MKNREFDRNFKKRVEEYLDCENLYITLPENRKDDYFGKVKSNIVIKFKSSSSLSLKHKLSIASIDSDSPRYSLSPLSKQET